jgi:hypothetical protein
LNRILRAAAAAALLLSLGVNAAQAADPASSPDCGLKMYGTIELTVAKDVLGVNNPNITFLPPPPFNAYCSLEMRSGKGAECKNCLGYFPLQLGRNVLEELRMYFATKEKGLYYTAADARK